MTTKNFAKSILIFSFVIIFTTIFTNKINANPIKLKDNQKEIIGTWQLKKSVSELKKQTNGNILPVVFAPDSLILAADNDSDEITINEGFSDFIQTNTFPTNGEIITKNLFQVGKVSAKASWKGNILVVEVLTENGDKMAEKFELSSNKKQLFVTIQAVEKKSAKNTKVVRVYERIADEDEDDDMAQVGISDFPF